MIFRFFNLEKIASKLIYLALAVLALTLLAVIFYPTPRRGNKTTDRLSSSFSGKEEKIAFLKDYINLPTEVEDVEYHVIYYAPSGLALRASEWDFQMIFKLRPEDLDTWLIKAEESQKEFNLAWAKELLPESWQLNSQPKYYIRSGEMTVFFKEAIILWKLNSVE